MPLFPHRTFNFGFFKTLKKVPSPLSDPLDVNPLTYADRYLSRIGKGSSRVVFSLSSKSALKVAADLKGIAQNMKEIEVSEDPDINILARVKDYSPDGLWVVSELVRPLSKGEFTKLIGCPPHTMYEALENTNSLAKLEARIEEIGNPNDKEYLDSVVDASLLDSQLKNFHAVLEKRPKAQEMFDSLLKLSGKYDIPGIEFSDEAQFGKTPDGRIVVLDYGLDRSTKNLFY